LRSIAESTTEMFQCMRDALANRRDKRHWQEIFRISSCESAGLNAMVKK
jgi:hypothetical protein